MKFLPALVMLFLATGALAVDPKDTMCVKQKDGTYKCKATGKIETMPCCDTPSNGPRRSRASRYANCLRLQIYLTSLIPTNPTLSTIFCPAGPTVKSTNCLASPVGSPLV